MREDVTKFSCLIEEIVESSGLSYMEAIIEYCEQNKLEIEVAAKLISTNLKSKLQIEAEDLHFLPKSNTAKLPI